MSESRGQLTRGQIPRYAETKRHRFDALNDAEIKKLESDLDLDRTKGEAEAEAKGCVVR